MQRPASVRCIAAGGVASGGVASGGVASGGVAAGGAAEAGLVAGSGPLRVHPPPKSNPIPIPIPIHPSARIRAVYPRHAAGYDVMMPIRAISPLLPEFRHAQTPANPGPAPAYYEWWYFEVEFNDDSGRPFRAITSFHYPHALDARRVLAHEHYEDYAARYTTHPGHYAGIASYVVDVEKTENVALLISRFRVQDIGTRVTVSRPGDPKVALRFGNSSFLENDDGTFTLTVRQRGKHPVSLTRTRDLDLELTARFTQNTPGFQPPDAVLLDQSGVQHHWACVMPNPVVRVDGVRVLRRRLNGSWSSLCKASAGVGTIGGYHDHQWGGDVFWAQVGRWSWGRVPLSRQSASRKILYFDIDGIGGGGYPVSHPDPILVEIPSGATAPRALDEAAGLAPFSLIGPVDSMNFGDGCKFGIQGQDVPYHRTAKIQGRDGAGVLHQLTITHERKHNVDTWPFYLRFAPPVKVAGLTAKVATISEIMQATRLRLPKTHKVLARSELITVTES